jgi:hypothetical protein
MKLFEGGHWRLQWMRVGLASMGFLVLKMSKLSEETNGDWSPMIVHVNEG